LLFLQTAPARRELNDNNMFCGLALVCVVKWQVNFRVGRFINHFGVRFASAAD
jgi:hypothetical protein